RGRIPPGVPMKWLLFALVPLVLGAGCTRERQARVDCKNPLDCRPPFSVMALDGSRLGDDTLAGKAVLVNFWATWCEPCKRELPAFEAVYSRHKGQGLEILGVVTSDNANDDAVANFASQRNISYPLV